MEKKIITEENIKNVLFNILNEEVSKVKREEFNRVQFKLDELGSSLNESMKELRKLDDSIPSGLKTICNCIVNEINYNLSNSQILFTQLKDKIRKHKKHTHSQNMVEKKT